MVSGEPVSISRHSNPRIQTEVRRLCHENRFDIVHAEQIQAWPQAKLANNAGIPAVIRELNVESVLWRFSGSLRPAPVKWAFRVEEGRISRWEAQALRSAQAIVVVTPIDVEPIRSLVGDATSVIKVPVPYPDNLQPAPTKLEGSPAVSIITSTEWLPAWDAIRKFVQSTWPEVLGLLPRAHLHVFGCSRAGPSAKGVTWHPCPDESQDAFPSNAIFLIPARHPTGVPIKGLEAWSRGLPLVVSPDTAEALDARHGEEVLIASDSESFARAIGDLENDQSLRTKVVSQGRKRLRERHSLSEVGRQLAKIYRKVANEIE
jgi:hypothetical protein